MKGKFATTPSRTMTGEWLITLEVDEKPQEYDNLKDKDLRIELKEYKERRSLNANAYFYVLVNKIAKVLNVTDTEIHNKLLSECLCYVMRNGVVDWLISDIPPDEYRLMKIGVDYYYDSLQVVYLGKANGEHYETNGEPKTSKIYWHVKGSHQMDTKEMSRLIEHTVQEAKNLDIETLTPAEIERMVKMWQPNLY